MTQNFRAIKQNVGHCSYLKRSDHQENAVYGYLRPLAPTRPLMREIVKQLIPYGFLDEGYTAKFNVCATCRRCVPVRINFEKFKSKRSARRLRRENSDLSCRIKKIDDSDIKDTLGHEQHNLFKSHRKNKFPGESLSLMEYQIFRDFYRTRDMTLEIRTPDKRLVCMSVLTQGSDYIYGVNTFYDIDFNNNDRSLGRFAIHSLIDAFRQDPAIQYFYLGSWLDEKTSGLKYKENFSGLEIITDDGWVDFSNDVNYKTPDYNTKMPANVEWQRTP